MAVYKRWLIDAKTKKKKKSSVFSYEFIFAGERYRGSTECTIKERAKNYEKDLRERLEHALSGQPTEKPEMRVRTVSVALDEYMKGLRVAHAEKTVVLARCCSAHLKRLLGNKIAADLDESEMLGYQDRRRKEGAGTRTVDLELSTLSRAFGAKWSIWWPKLKRLDQGSDKGKVIPLSDEERILEAAAKSRSRYLYTYLTIAFSTGFRAGEIRLLKWDRFVIGPSHLESFVRTGKSKTKAGENRSVPMSQRLWAAMVQYRAWYESRLGEPRPVWYVFPTSSAVAPVDPTRPTTTIKTAWQTLKEELKLSKTYRLHDTRHTVATTMAIAGVPEAKRRYLMGHIDENVINRYTHLQAEDCRSDMERAEEIRRRNSAQPPTIPPTVDTPRKNAANRRVM